MLGGICGIGGKGSDINHLLTLLFSLQNRGEDYCGVVTQKNHHLALPCRYEGKVLESFTEDDVKTLSGNYGIGSVHPYVKQPIAFDSRFGEIALVYAGKIFNKKALTNQLIREGHSLSLVKTDIEIIGKLMTENSNASNITEGLEYMSGQVQGVYVLGVLSREGAYCMRSPNGLEPLVVGGDENLQAFASESCALKELEFKRNQYRDVHPGEIVWISEDGIKTAKQLNGKLGLCAFEPGYWGRIDSVFDEISTKLMRERAGIILAQEDKERGFLDEVSKRGEVIVIPVRDSGAGYAIGYHHGSGISWDEGLFKNWYVTRTFLQGSTSLRIKTTERKQSVIEDAVQDKIVIILDDSIREGATIRKKLNPLLRWGGAKEVHVRIGSPENKYYCKYSLFPKKRGKLLSANRTLEEQREFIGADSLRFISLEGYIKALGIEKDKVCLGCWTGNFPF